MTRRDRHIMAAVGEKRTIRCPTCGKTVAYDGTYFPFCCQRCKLVDLGKWFSEEYAIPCQDEDSGDDNDEGTPAETRGLP